MTSEAENIRLQRLTAFGRLLPLILLVMSGCILPHRGSTAETRFSSFIGTPDINRAMTISTYQGGLNEGNWTSTFSLQVRNNSDQLVGFFPSSDISGWIFDPQSGEWQKVPNSVRYSSGMRVLGPVYSIEVPPVAPVDFLAGKPRSSNVSEIRVVVRGNLLGPTLELQRKIAAYYDVKIIR